MRTLPITPAVLVLLLGFVLESGCYRGPGAPLDTASLDPGQDHRRIAVYYGSEATVSRQKAEELANRAVVYEQLFGRESDWVTGTRLLVQFYEETAREQDRLASLHLELSRGQSQMPATRSRVQ